MAGSGHPTADALVAAAVAATLGEEVSAGDVAAAADRISRSHAERRRLRALVGSANDPDIAVKIADWLEEARETEAEAAARERRLGDMLLQPAQTVAMGAAATAGVGAAVGTVGLAVGLAAAVALACCAGVISVARWRASRREDLHGGRGERIGRLLDDVAEARSGAPQPPGR